MQVRHHLFFTSIPLLSPLGLQLLPLHRLVQLVAREVLNNLQWFGSHHPPTFTGGGGLMVADHWFRQIKKVLEAMDITSDATKIKLAAFQLEGESQVWWD